MWDLPCQSNPHTVAGTIECLGLKASENGKETPKGTPLDYTLSIGAVGLQENFC